MAKKISAEKLYRLKQASAAALPDEPGKAGMTPSAIKRALYTPYIGDNESLATEINRIVDELNGELDIKSVLRVCCVNPAAEKYASNWLVAADGETIVPKKDDVYTVSGSAYDGRVFRFDGEVYRPLIGSELKVTVGRVTAKSLPPAVNPVVEANVTFDETEKNVLLNFNFGIPDSESAAKDGTGKNIAEQFAALLSDVQNLREEMTEGDNCNHFNPKTLYNLGAFDTYVSNGDGTATITRKTNSFIINKENITELKTSPSTGLVTCYTDIRLEHVYAFDNQNIKGVTNKGLSVWSLGMNYAFNNSVDIYSGTVRICKEGFSLEDYKNFCPIYVQYELAEKYWYAENVIENQPIHTLPQTGEEWLNDEWEKGLNFSTVKEVISGKSTTIAENLPAGTYTFSLNDSNFNPNAQYFIIIDGVNGSDTPHTQFPYTFSISKPSTIGVYVNIVGGTTSIMLNKGTHAYPYVPFNGAIVHEKELSSVQEQVSGKVNKSGDTMNGILRFVGEFENCPQIAMSNDGNNHKALLLVSNAAQTQILGGITALNPAQSMFFRTTGQPQWDDAEGLNQFVILKNGLRYNTHKFIDNDGNLRVERSSSDVKGPSIYVKRTDTGNEISFGIGVSGVNRGIWDCVLEKWLFYTDGKKVFVDGYVPYSSANPAPPAVGEVIIRLDETEPASMYANTTFEKVAQGRMLIGADSTYALGATGGSANAVIVRHSHTVTVKSCATSGSGAIVPYTPGIGSVGTSVVGEDGKGKNMPPYLAVNYWKRVS